MTNLEMVAAELEAAKKKHPHFVDSMRWSTTRDWKRRLRAEREGLKWSNHEGRVVFADVIYCEIAEAMVAYMEHDLAHARQELAQCAAVCIRGMEYIEQEMEEKK